MNICLKPIILLFLILVIQTPEIIGDQDAVVQENVEDSLPDSLQNENNEPDALPESNKIISEVDNEKIDTTNETFESKDYEKLEEPSDVITNATSKALPQKKGNLTLADDTNANFTKVNCIMDKSYGPVEIVNHTRLMELLILETGTPHRSRSSKEDKSLPGSCILVMFYARWCVFSSQAAPHFNAISRFYPHLKVVAIDAMKYQNFNTQYGIVGVPTLMLVHNAKPVAKFNDTVYTLETFSKFITHLTNLQPNGSLYVTSADFAGPVSSTPSNETDYCLVLSWIFIVACLLYFTTQCQWWRRFLELVQTTWRESNAQHEHID